MLSRVLLLVTVFSLAACWNAPAQEGTPAGEFSAIPLQVDVKGNGAKFNEYRGLRDGVHGYISFRYHGGKTYLDFRAGDIGYKDQKYELNGGRWGSFRYHLGHDEKSP
jgi:hypothetical protein